MIIVGLPSFAGHHPLFTKSIDGALKDVPDIQKVYRYSLNTCTARNEIVDVGLTLNATHVFFMDVDMVFPELTLSKLLSHNVPIVGGYYHRKISGFLSNVFQYDENHNLIAKFFPKSGLVEVDAIGTGCMLINTDVFKQLPVPYFNYELAPDKNRLMTEDNVFCRNAQNAGIKIYCDTNIRCGHIGEMIVTPSDHESKVRVEPIR